MKVVKSSGQVKVTLEIDEARFRNKELTVDKARAIRQYEEGFLQDYAKLIVQNLAGSLFMGEHTPRALEFLANAQSQASHALLQYAESVRRK